MDRYIPEARFPTTHWTLVGQAGKAGSEALGRLLGRYLPALVAHLVHGKRIAPEEAEDLVQDFVAGKVLEKNLISRANPDLGKFRTLLLTSLDRFLIDQIRAKNAKVRSPGDGQIVALGEGEAMLEASPRNSDSFELAWARRVLAETIERMRDECNRSERMDVWNVFDARLFGPVLRGSEPMDYDELVERFGLTSPSQAANLLVTAKRMFARVLRAVVAEYASNDEEIEAEIAELKSILAGNNK
ncbi:MAG: sigma-70 family RNA polymerase sigma factor [Pirellulales bacterium]|nr:sigma-70 family RNA polymerase sigma factor [Pirellulales bacterium]